MLRDGLHSRREQNPIMNASAHLFQHQEPAHPPSPAAGARAKPRAIVFGSGIGMFPPLLERFRDEFDIVATLRPQLPRVYELAFRALSVRWPREAWYRRWRHYVEKTPFAFRAVTRRSAATLAKEGLSS